MKNFTAKTADFDNLTISGQAPITPSDLGTAPNQIPLNKDLGTLAYQDAVNLDDVSADMLELRAIAAEISDSAVDVFVYDTSRDSDGGAWRKRTQHTSWYNEELNTDTRGGRREFPAVAVIVAEAGKVTIYDGDDPDLSMWMVFDQGGSYLISNNLIGATTASNSAITCLNGILSLTTSTEAIYIIKFISDKSQRVTNSADREYLGGIGERNSGKGLSQKNSTNYIVNTNCNDVAMTILPNAPIDADTGLPVPTIAVATDGGVSVIKDDGSVYDISGVSVERVAFYNDNKSLLIREAGNACSYGAIPVSDNSWTSWREGFFNETTTFPCTLNQINIGLYSNGNYDLGIPSEFGLSLIKVNPSDQNISTGAYITSKYNTGWMPGDIKLATLSDTTVETIGTDSSELVTNGNFSTDSDWSNSTSGGGGATNWTIASGVATSSSSAGYMIQAKGTVGTMITITYEITSYTSGDLFCVFGSGGTGLLIKTNTSIGTHSITGMVTDNSDVGFYSLGILSIDNISVRATTELITNGNFSTNLGDEWSDESTGTGSISRNASGYIDLISQGDGNRAIADQSFSTVIGKTYTLSLDVIATDTSSSVYLGTSAGANDITSSALNLLSLGAYSFTFVATTTVTFIRLWGSTGTSTNMFDNISVRPAVDDRSVNNNGLQVIGEINKTRVAPGADLVAYSGFSENNYLVQPYNEDLNFGTGDFSIITWVNKNSTDTQIILNSGYESSSRLYIYISNTNELRFAAGGVGTKVYGSIASDSIWNQITIVRKDGVVYGYINGVLQASYSNPDAVTHSSNDTLKIGRHATGLYPFGGSLSLIRFTATSITLDQIAKIYRDEKALFQDGAQATLYGTSDAVTALAYDDSNQLLHVGTASGRSDFRGLARVNNTTTAISNSISAAEGTIIQN